MSSINFLFVVEQGDLEKKSSLLVSSIREFAGEYRDSDIWALQPRKGKNISRSTLDFFKENNVFYVNANLNTDWPDYGIANKIYASAFVESLVERNVDTLVFLDSDTVILKSPKDLLLSKQHSIAIRPVDYINIGQKVEEPINDYWKIFYDLLDVDLPRVWAVKTNACQNLIRAYFNSGLIAVNPELGLFRKWLEGLKKLKKDHRLEAIPYGSKHFFHIDQAILSSLIVSDLSKDKVKLLDAKYNYPLHIHAKGDLPSESIISNLSEIKIAHYHHIFYSLDWLSLIRVEPELKKWLLQQLPLQNLRSKQDRLPGFFPMRKLYEKMMHSKSW